MMMVPEDIIHIMKKARKEMDDNKDLVCSMTEILIVFMPIIPSSLWNRVWILCLYILLYSVNAQDKYYEMKNKYLMAPCYEYDSLSDDDSQVDNDLCIGIKPIKILSKANASKANASKADASKTNASDEDEDADASASEEDNDSDSDSDYEDNNETKKNN